MSPLACFWLSSAWFGMGTRRRNLEGKSARFTQHQVRKLRSTGYCPRSLSLIRKFETWTAKPYCASWAFIGLIYSFYTFLGTCFYRIVGHSRNRVPGQKAQGYTFAANMSTSELADTCYVIVILWLHVFALNLACSVCFQCSFSYSMEKCGAARSLPGVLGGRPGVAARMAHHNSWPGSPVS